MEQYGGLPVGRVPRGVMYFFLSLTGVFALLFPSSLVGTATGVGVYVWGSFLLIGGIGSLWGTITDKWMGEYVGLIPLIFAFLIYSTVIFVTVPVPLPRIAFGFLLLAMLAAMIVRHREVSYIRRVATHTAKNSEEG